MFNITPKGKIRRHKPCWGGHRHRPESQNRDQCSPAEPESDDSLSGRTKKKKIGNTDNKKAHNRTNAPSTHPIPCPVGQAQKKMYEHTHQNGIIEKNRSPRETATSQESEPIG